jgi:hypothetical protein
MEHPPSTHITFTADEISAGLSQVAAWFARLGVASKPKDRLNNALETTRRLKSFLDEYSASHRMPTNEPPHAQAIQEAFEFYLIHKGFSDGSVADDILKQKLAQVIGGPGSLLLENQKNSAGRNIMFELALAAQWKIQGLQVTEGDPDICIDLGETRFHIECKRPFGEHSVRANLRDAAAQISAKLSRHDHPASFGIVAVSLSRLLNPGNVASFAPVELRGRTIEDAIIALRHSHPEWRKLRFHPSTAALLFHATMPWLGRGEIDYVSVSQFIKTAKSNPGYEILRNCFPNAAEAPTYPF